MEIQRIIWSWEMIVRQLLETEPGLGRALDRSCRPIEAQRYHDGRLLVVLGCWWPADMESLNKEPNHSRLNELLGEMLADKVTTVIARWPGGMAKSLPAKSEDEQIPAPDILQGLPQEAREEAAKCESPIQRLFFARAYAKGIKLQCQYRFEHYRLDFAIANRRVGAEVIGWDWRIGSSGVRDKRERQQELEDHGWQLMWFSGSQVLADVDKCIATLTSTTRSSFGPGQQPLPTRYPREPRKPFSSIGTNRPPDRNGGRPKR